jgi:TIR domain
MSTHNRRILDPRPTDAARSLAQAFISYSRADWTYVEILAREMRAVGISTWVDIENIQPGDQWRPTIETAIKTSRAFVFCISPFSLESHRTYWEFEEALAKGLLIFPVMIESTPIEMIPERLRRYHFLEFFRDAPALGAKRAARELGRLLGLQLADLPALQALDPIDALVLRFGSFESRIEPRSLPACKIDQDAVVMDFTVSNLDHTDFKVITDRIEQCRFVYALVGEAANTDELALICGTASAILGPKRVYLIGAFGGAAIAARLANLLQARFVHCEAS